MTLADYRASGRRSRFPFISVLSAILMIVAAVFLGIELIDYSENTDSLGADVTIGGIQVGGLSENARVSRLDEVYVEQPIYLSYNGNPIWLYPSEIGFQLDLEGMQATATRVASNRDTFWEGFWNFLWREPQPAIEVDLIANYSETELDDYLQDLANRYDAPADGPGFDPVDLTFSGSSGNTRLDREATKPLIDAALFEADSSQRRIELPTIAVESEPATMETLRQAMISFLDSQGFFYNGTTSVVSMFVMDLETGEEMGIQENVRHSGVSTIKLGILINFFRDKITSPDDDEKFLLVSSVACSANSAANLLMYITSDDGSWVDGSRNASETMCLAGAANSAIRSNLFIGTAEDVARQGYNPDLFYAISSTTPCPSAEVAGAQEDTSTAAAYDPYNYTTAADMGTLLMMTYDCAKYGSGLQTVFPEEITQTECQQILEILRSTQFHHMSELGVPEGTDISHKVGYGGETSGDISLVYSPGGDYIFVVYIWEEDLDFDGIPEVDRWFLIGDLARIVYNYFNPTAPLLETRAPVDPNGNGAACVLPRSGAEINLSDINQGRYNEDGTPLPSACYDWPECRPFDNWGRD